MFQCAGLNEMTKTDLTFLTIAEAAKLIQTRALSPVELTQALLRRVEALDEQINAFLQRYAGSWDLSLRRGSSAARVLSPTPSALIIADL